MSCSQHPSKSIAPFATGLVLTLVSHMAIAGQPLAKPTAQLSYRIQATDETCPDEATFRQAVAVRMGYDPFVQLADRTLVVTIRQDSKHLEGTIESQSPSQPTGRRTMDAEVGRCDELADSLAVALVVAVDPLRLSAPEKEPAPALEAPEPPPAKVIVLPTPPAPLPERKPAPPAPKVPRPKLELSVGPMVSWGTAPDAAFGLQLDVSLRWPSFSVGLDGRGDFYARTEQDGYTITSAVLGGGPVVCLHLGPAFGCGVGVVATHQAESRGLAEPEKDRAFWAAAGPRLGVQWDLDATWSLYVRGDLLAAFTRNTIYISDRPVWTSSSIASSLGLGIGARL